MHLFQPCGTPQKEFFRMDAVFIWIVVVQTSGRATNGPFDFQPITFKKRQLRRPNPLPNW